jgi:hypothetical protein
MVQLTHSPDPATLGTGAGIADHANGGWDPAPVAATGATAGIPGTWTPPGSTPPATVAALQSSGVVASPATGWTAGQYVQTGTAGAPGQACWTGSGWVGGPAPAAAKAEAKKSTKEEK